MNGEAGFTLLEVLIALVILAVGSAGLIGAVRRDLLQQGELEDRTIALFVAQNRLAELHAAHAWIEPGTTTETATMAGRDWTLKLDASVTAEPDMEQVAVAVARNGTAPPSASLTGFIGRH